MDIFSIIMNAVDDFDEGFENLLEKLNDKIEGKNIDNNRYAEEIEETNKIEHNEKSNIIDISAEYVYDDDIDDDNI